MVAGALLAGVDQVLGERADDAVASGIDLADLAAVLAGGLDHPAGGCVDDGGHAAGLGVEGVLGGCHHGHTAEYKARRIADSRRVGTATWFDGAHREGRLARFQAP